MKTERKTYIIYLWDISEQMLRIVAINIKKNN